MTEFFKQVSSSSSKVSSKRVVTLIAFVMMCIAFIGNLVLNWTIEDYIFNSMSYIVIAGLGFTASEWLFSRKSPKDEQPHGGGGNYGQYGGGSHGGNNNYDLGYEEGYQAAKEECLSGNSETEEDMY